MSGIKGVIVPIVTPFNRDEAQTVNYAAADKLVDKLVAAGVDGIFTLGSNGEFHMCSHDEKVDFSKHVIEHVADRVPVYVGTGACSAYEACELSREAEAMGAAGVSVINPYFMKVSDAEIVSYYTQVAESVSVPVMLYNIPKSTGMNISPAVLEELAPIDNVRAIKDSSGDMDNLAAYVEVGKKHGVDVLCGSDGKIMTAYGLGASGAVAGTANLIPEVIVNLVRAIEAGDTAAAEKYQADVEPIRDVLHMGSTPAMLKRSVELSGIEVGAARKPVADTCEHDDAVRAMLDHYGIAHA